MSKELGYKIQRVRELMGIKQDIIADGLGIKQNTYSDIEAGKIELSVSDERFKKLAELLGTTPEFIENFDDRRIVNIINHHNGNGTAAANNHFNIQPNDDLQKLVEVIATPYREQIATLKELAASRLEEVQFWRNHFKKGE